MDWDSLNTDSLFGDFSTNAMLGDSLDDAVEAALNDSSIAQNNQIANNNANNNNQINNNSGVQNTQYQYDSDFSHSQSAGLTDYTLGSETMPETPHSQTLDGLPQTMDALTMHCQLQKDYFQSAEQQQQPAPQSSHSDNSFSDVSLPSGYSSLDASDVSVYGFAPVHDVSSQSSQEQEQAMNNHSTVQSQNISNSVQSTVQYDNQSQSGQSVQSGQYNGLSQPTVQSQPMNQTMSNNGQQTQATHYNTVQSQPVSTAQSQNPQSASVQYDNGQSQTSMSGQYDNSQLQTQTIVQSQSTVHNNGQSSAQSTGQYDNGMSTQTQSNVQSTVQYETPSHIVQTDFSNINTDGIFSPSQYLQPEPQTYPCTSAFQAPQQLNFEPQLDGVEFLPGVMDSVDVIQQSQHQHSMMMVPVQTQVQQSQNMAQAMVPAQSHSQQTTVHQAQSQNQTQLQVPVQNHTQAPVQVQSLFQTHNQNQSQPVQTTLQLPPQSAQTQIQPQTMAQRRQRKRQSRKQAASKKQSQRKGMVPVQLGQSQPMVLHQAQPVQPVQPVQQHQREPMVQSQHSVQPQQSVQSQSMVPHQAPVQQSMSMVPVQNQFESMMQFPVQPVQTVQHHLQLPQGLHLPQMHQIAQAGPIHHPIALPQVYPQIASNRPWRTQAFRTWYATQTQQKLEPATAEELEICQQLERAVAAQMKRQDDQQRTVRELDHLEGLNLAKFDAQNEYTDGVPEMIQIYHCEKEFKEKDEDTQARERLIMNMQALDMRTHMMLYELNFSNKTHFHRNRVCDHTCTGTAPPTTLTRYSRPKAHPMILPEEAVRWRHRTIVVRDLFYSCKDRHQQRVQMLVSYLEEDFMKIRVTSERAKQILIHKYKNPYLPLFDHIARQVMPEYECPELFQYLLSAMPNVYLSAYYRVEGKKNRKPVEDGVYHPDEKDVGERFCGICNKWFKTRNHNWASHMTSAHGICSATKSIYPLPLAVILGFPSLTQKEDELIKIQELKFKPNSHGDMHIVNDNRPQHHLLPDKEIKLSGLCSVCWHYIPLYTKRGATVWTTWFRHQDKHIRQMNQERQGGVGTNRNNPRNNKRRRGEISEEVRIAWEKKNGIVAKKRKLDDDDMSFLEEQVEVEGDPQWLSEDFEVFSQE